MKEVKIAVTVQDVLNELDEGVSYIIDITMGADIYFQVFRNSEIMYHCNHNREDGRCTQEEWNNLMKMTVRHKVVDSVVDEDNEDILQPVIAMQLFLNRE